MLPRTSLGTVGLIVGGALTIMGFIAYFTDNATLNLAGFFYGVPVLLGGFALKASELKPTPISPPTPPEIITLREQQATDTQKQVLKDVTRYRYGQDAHLDVSLERIGLSPTDEERPVLQSLREESIEGAYALLLHFESPLVSFETWQQKQEKIEAFFGPGIRARLTQTGEDDIELALISAAPPSKG
ncbi:MAG: DUF2854 domain-containing protein [Elainellaceae cyanobacterium]